MIYKDWCQQLNIVTVIVLSPWNSLRRYCEWQTVWPFNLASCQQHTRQEWDTLVYLSENKIYWDVDTIRHVINITTLCTKWCIVPSLITTAVTTAANATYKDRRLRICISRNYFPLSNLWLRKCSSFATTIQPSLEQYGSLLALVVGHGSRPDVVAAHVRLVSLPVHVEATTPALDVTRRCQRTWH